MSGTPGVLRPYTLIDVLGAINGQSQTGTSASTGASATAYGQVAEADEQITAADSAFATVQAAPGWDQGVWGVGTWG